MIARPAVVGGSLLTLACFLVSLGIVGCSRENAKRGESDLPSQATTTTSTDVELKTAVEMETVIAEDIEVADLTNADTESPPDPILAGEAETESASEKLDTNSAVDLADAPEPSDEPPFQPPGDSPPETPTPYRIVLPTTRGVLLVDVEIWIDDESLAKTFDRQVKTILSAATESQADELPSWTALMDYVGENADRFGRGIVVQKAQYAGMIRRYDVNSNELADFKEAAKFLFRDSTAATAFRMQGTDAFRFANRSRSRMFSAIDADADGRLDSKEIETATEAVMRLDVNSDRRLDLAELSDAPETSPAAWDRSRSGRHGNVAMDLHGFIDWSMVSYALDRSKTMHPFGRNPIPVVQLDADTDGSLNAEEASGLAKLAPDVKFRIRFSNQNDPSEPSLEVVSVPSEGLELSVTKAGTGRVVIKTPSFSLIVHALEPLANATNQGIHDSQVHGRAAEFPDAVFASLDQNHDLCLSERECSEISQALSQYASSPIKPSDIPECYLVSIGRRPSGQLDQLFDLSRLASASPNVGPNWFQAMDANEDGDVSEAEFIGDRRKFTELDSDADGFIAASEVSSP